MNEETEKLKSNVDMFVLPKKLRMNAYYYRFKATGVRDIDQILSAVAMAGKGFHNTDQWNEKVDHFGASYIEIIQEMANRSASKMEGMRQCLQMCFDDSCRTEGKLSKKTVIEVMKHVNTKA